MKGLLHLVLLLGITATHAFEVYLGTAAGKAQGLFYSELNSETGALTEAWVAIDIHSPGFLTTHPDFEILYAFSGKRDTNQVEAYRFLGDGELELVNRVPNPTGNAAHIAVHPSGEFLLTAQYGAGNIALFPLGDNGNLGECAQVIEHVGPGSEVHTRQKEPHPHWVGFSPDGRFAYVPDLGLDTIEIYSVDAETPALSKIGSARTVPGGGPRHMRFSKDGEFVYLLNELTVSVSVFSIDAGTGQLTFVTEVANLTDQEKEASPVNTGSEILVSDCGKYVYTGNRGHNSVSTFKIGDNGAALERIDIDEIRGDWPRNISLSPDGKWLLAGGQRSGTVSVFSVSEENGDLEYVSQIDGVPYVSCILFR